MYLNIFDQSSIWNTEYLKDLGLKSGVKAIENITIKDLGLYITRILEVNLDIEIVNRLPEYVNIWIYDKKAL